MHTVDYSNCGGGDREEEDDVGGGGADDHDNNARANSTTQITNNNKNNSGGGSGGGSSLLDELEEAARLSNPSYHLIKVGIPSLRHFVFRYKSIGQHTEPAPAAPYSNKEDFARFVVVAVVGRDGVERTHK